MDSNIEHTLRNDLTPQQRGEDMYMSIDPGFVHVRKIETLLGSTGMKYVDKAINDLPEDLPDWMKRVRVDHIYTRYLIGFSDVHNMPTLGALVGNEKGRLFSSIENTEPTEGIWDGGRVITYIKSNPTHGKYRIRLEYDSSLVTSDTVKMQLSNGDELAIIAQYSGREDNELIFHPLVIGAPWLTAKSENSSIDNDSAPWHSHDFFENFVEDIDEFAKVRDEPKPVDISVMNDISENAFKQCLGEIINEQTGKDWGGEISDHYSANLHIGERRITAAFVLKGPAKFTPMTMKHLGKNGDQIFRLSQEPAQLLVVQHSHQITSAVRATLRAFAVKAGESRRYCLIDGQDSLRLLKAYGKLERALELSNKAQAENDSTDK